ncbi:MAG TPA: hypothetical protein VJS30_05585 [Paraburkholderia sp.]|nr:hypothetical protein [Paraburkholderia sp.]
MQVEFAFAASSAAAVATHQGWFVRSAETGMSAASMIVALPEETDMRSGHDHEYGWARLNRARSTQVGAAEPAGATIASAVMKIGTHVAYVGGGTKAVFVADQKVLADAAVNGNAAGTQGPSAGLSAAVRGQAASLDAAGRAHAKGSPKMGVMTYDVRRAGREARRANVVANVTGS